VVSGAYMLVLGLGMGLVMQVLVLAVQNAVDYRDLGVATSGTTMFRQMGGAIGTAAFGAIFNNQLGTQRDGQAAASPVGSTGWADRQAFRPPWSASACGKPSLRSCSAARALVCSRGQVQYRT
jgi:hypothetical protein